MRYRTSAELMDYLAKSDRVAESLTWKVTQFALGRPLTAVDAPVVIKTDLVYADGMSAPTGTDRPNPRTISNMLFNQQDVVPDAISCKNVVLGLDVLYNSRH